MVDINLSQFAASSDAEQHTVGRNKNSQITFQNNLSELSDYIADAQFNSKLGVLSIIKQNGSILEIPGFLTLDQLGRGERGRKGAPGRNGRDGIDGEDGDKGKTGCQGPAGEPGDKGKNGTDGTDGEVGNPGEPGCDGVKGDKGPVGDKGDKGFKGEIGEQGISCIKGYIGPQGPKPRNYAHIGEKEPGPEFNLWAIPFEDTIPVVEVPAGITIEANAIDAVLIQQNGDVYGIAVDITISDIKGVKGNSEISWGGDYINDSRITGDVSANTRRLTLTVAETIPKGQDVEFSGQIRIQVRDTFNDELGEKIVSYRFRGNNDQVIPQNLKGIAVDRTINEGADAVFTLNLDQAPDKNILVNLAFTGDTGRLENSNSTSVIIQKGQTTISISRATVNQGGVQPDGLIRGVFTATNVTEASPDSMIADITIKEQVVPTTVKVSNRSFAETDTNREYLIPLTLDGELSGNGSLTYTIKDGSAVYGNQFTSSFGKTRSVTFNQNFQTINIPITVVGDNLVRGNTQFTIDFSNVSSNLSIEKNSITINITEDDTNIGGGGGGCVAFGTPIMTPTGNVAAELISIGDKVVSRNIKGMPDASKGSEYFEWQTTELLSDISTSIVQGVKIDTYDTIVKVNEMLITPDHPVLVRRKGVISWMPAGMIEKHDYVEVNGFWKEILEFSMFKGDFKVVDIDVEPHDVYYAGGMLVHNSEFTLINKR